MSLTVVHSVKFKLAGASESVKLLRRARAGGRARGDAQAVIATRTTRTSFFRDNKRVHKLDPTVNFKLKAESPGQPDCSAANLKPGPRNHRVIPSLRRCPPDHGPPRGPGPGPPDPAGPEISAA